VWRKHCVNVKKAACAVESLVLTRKSPISIVIGSLFLAGEVLKNIKFRGR